jgi:hypothetical protein
MQTTSKLAQTMDTDVILILDNPDKKVTITGKARGVVTDVDRDFEDIYSGYDSAFPRRFLNKIDAKTTIEWQYDDEKAYTIKVQEKAKKKVQKKKNTDRVLVSFFETEDVVFEAQDGERLSVFIEDGLLKIQARDQYGQVRLYAAVRDWVSFVHERTAE